MAALTFTVQANDPKSSARTGILTTLHGSIQTPAFVPVGTKASIKGVLPNVLPSLGAQVVLANTYHLYLQPGEQVVKNAGGLAQFMDWRVPVAIAQTQQENMQSALNSYGPTMTDSGGFQVFSLGSAFGRTITKIASGEELPREQGVATYDDDVRTQHGQLAVIDDQGVTFTSHLDGSLHRFTPERSVEIQHALGADVFFAFDECTAPTEPYAYQREAMERTHRWAQRSLSAHRQNLDAARSQSIFGIVQGGRHEDLRRESAREIASMNFDGFGIGGSFSKEDMMGALQAAIPELPEEKPRHFLGIGEPADILTGIAAGMDLFDCVAATRLGRHGTIYTPTGPLSIRQEKYHNDFTSLMFGNAADVLAPHTPFVLVPGTEGFTRAYLSHLIRSNELLGQTIASMHNLGFILQLVDRARDAIQAGTFTEYRKSFLDLYYR